MTIPLEDQLCQSCELGIGPASLRGALAGRSSCSLLESAPGFGNLGRYSLYAWRPRAVFEIVGQGWRLSRNWPGVRPPSHLGPLEALGCLLRQTRTSAMAFPAASCATAFPAVSDSMFTGGWIGFLGYDLALLLERLPRSTPRESGLPDLYLGYHDTFAVHDHQSGELRLHAIDRFGEGAVARARRMDRWRRLLDHPPVEDPGGPLIQGGLTSNFTPDEYCWAVGRILEYIRAGDIFQANLSQRYSAPLASASRRSAPLASRRSAGSAGPAELFYLRCAEQSPAPFEAFLRHGGWSIVSNSPERFFQLAPDRSVQTRPVKGTRPRGRDAIHDLLLRAELGASLKDRAELTMIVDLERNDLGRVCRYGSVRVAEHAVVESFSNVHHLVSTVEGQLRPECDVVDLIRAMLPGGSITGAPKIRAMEIIDEMERCRRGVYTGAIGYLSDHGRADFSIAIRTAVIERGRVHFHVGGGIVADSDPLSEYRETLAKGQRLRDALLGE